MGKKYLTLLGGEGDGWAAEDEDLDIPADLELTSPTATAEGGGDDGYFVAPTRWVNISPLRHEELALKSVPVAI
jgi:hypothetical protein